MRHQANAIVGRHAIRLGIVVVTCATSWALASGDSLLDCIAKCEKAYEACLSKPDARKDVCYVAFKRCEGACK